MSSVASEYVWMPDPRDPDDGEMVETLLLTRRYAIALPETMPRRHVGIPSWQIAGMLDAKREVDEPKIMAFAGRVADALFGEGNWTHGERAEIVARKSEQLIAAMAACGCTLNNAVMQHMFLALPVIPELRLTDLGLVDVTTFGFVDLFVK